MYDFFVEDGNIIVGTFRVEVTLVLCANTYYPTAIMKGKSLIIALFLVYGLSSMGTTQCR